MINVKNIIQCEIAVEWRGEKSTCKIVITLIELFWLILLILWMQNVGINKTYGSDFVVFHSFKAVKWIHLQKCLWSVWCVFRETRKKTWRSTEAVLLLRLLLLSLDRCIAGKTYSYFTGISTTSFALESASTAAVAGTAAVGAAAAAAEQVICFHSPIVCYLIVFRTSTQHTTNRMWFSVCSFFLSLSFSFMCCAYDCCCCCCYFRVFLCALLWRFVYIERVARAVMI